MIGFDAYPLFRDPNITPPSLDGGGFLFGNKIKSEKDLWPAYLKLQFVDILGSHDRQGFHTQRLGRFQVDV